MRKIKQLLALSSATLVLGLGAGNTIAQGAGGGPGGPGGFGGGGPGGGGFNFDPAQMQQMMEDMRKRMSDAQREQLEVKDDAEWNIIQPQIQKVTDARAQANSGVAGGMMGMMGGRRGGRGGAGGGGGFGGPGGPQGGMPAMPGMATVKPDPAAEALQRAIDAKASNDELKAAVAKLVESRKQKQASLEKAESDLRSLLSVRQEAIAYSMGLL